MSVVSFTDGDDNAEEADDAGPWRHPPTTWRDCYRAHLLMAARVSMFKLAEVLIRQLRIILAQGRQEDLSDDPAPCCAGCSRAASCENEALGHRASNLQDPNPNPNENVAN